MLMRRVLFSLLGVLLTGCASSEPSFELGGTSATDAGTFKAGAAAREFTPEKGYPLAGFGGGERRVAFPLYWGLGWPGRLALDWMRWRHQHGVPAAMLAQAAGTHDALQAKALVLVPEKGPPYAVVRIDAIESNAALHDRVVELTRDLGFERQTLVLAATHTHSGVGGFIDEPLAELVAMDIFRNDTREKIAHAAADAVRAAYAGARPASIGFARARDEDAHGKPLVASNRRAGRVHGDEDDIDREIDLVFVRDAAGGAPIATLACYAVHPTVLGTANRFFSSDLVAPIESAITTCAGGGEGLFVNGAEGDIGPRQGSGGLRECRREGEAFAAVCSSALAAPPQLSARASFRGAVASEEMGDPEIFFTPGDRESFYDGDAGAGKFITAPLTLPLNLLAWIAGFTDIRFAFTWNFSVGAVVDLSHYGKSSRFRGGGIRVTTEKEDVVLFAAPCEATHTVGRELKKRGLERGATRVLVLGLADDAMSYIATRDEYFEGGYEATMTLFGPDTADKLYDLERGVLDGLGFPKKP
jgi:hypothetical protein